MKNIIIVVICLSLVACATTGNIAAINARIETRADRIANIGAAVIQRVGPVMAAGTCVAAPEYCVAAKAAYRAANATIVAIRAAKESDDGLKLATLAQEFVANIDIINDILVATGQEKIDLTEFQKTVKEVS